jgi:Domain of unknown function (DUF4160)
MGSLRFDGVRFRIYSDDHPPAHVHAYRAEMSAVIDLLPGGGVALSSRAQPYWPPNAKIGDLRKVLRVAKKHEAKLRNEWQRMREER